MSIQFYNANVELKLKEKTKLKHWLKDACLKEEGRKIKKLGIVFMSDEELLDYNLRYLKHNTYTDIITFDLSGEKEQKKGEILGELYISIDRVFDNAQHQNIPFLHELCRVMIHGVLHLLGYKDKKSEEKKEIRKREDHHLKKLSSTWNYEFGPAKTSKVPRGTIKKSR